MTLPMQTAWFIFDCHRTITLISSLPLASAKVLTSDGDDTAFLFSMAHFNSALHSLFFTQLMFLRLAAHMGNAISGHSS